MESIANRQAFGILETFDDSRALAIIVSRRYFACECLSTLSNTEANDDD